MAWLSSEVFVAVIVVEYRCEFPLNEGDSEFSCLNFVQANIGHVSLFSLCCKNCEKQTEKVYFVPFCHSDKYCSKCRYCSVLLQFWRSSSEKEHVTQVSYVCKSISIVKLID